MAASFAVVIGSRCVSKQSPVPSRTVCVTDAIAARQTNGSGKRRYCGARGRPPGNGVSRLTGMWLCSWNQIDSTPRSSAQRPKSSGDDVSSAGKVTPTSTAQPGTEVARSAGAHTPVPRYLSAATAAVAPSPATVTA